MVDAIGRKLNVGDHIAWKEAYGSGIAVGEIASFTSSGNPRAFEFITDSYLSKPVAIAKEVIKLEPLPLKL